MFGFIKKISNSVELTKNIQHLCVQIENISPVLQQDPYSYLDEVIALNFYFQRDVVDAMEQTNYELHNKIYLSNGQSITVAEILTNIGGFFFEISSGLNDKNYLSIIEDIGKKGQVYRRLENMLPKSLKDFDVINTYFDGVYLSYR
ncbi:hypothetical protein KIH41_02220 [Litoribacter ruber]|uniref:hypothetical protein n=1 Tax=Litoribacter ruber TaxID=702568 RepID=UPI001BDAE623|nr:hypothetical protein [Litoribacter ruber]MBT0810095.1 hypothetical protein [Litoribacter ruber]